MQGVLSRQVMQDLVLVGGGHSHAIALKSFGMKPMDAVRITLITDVMHTPYSGMLPGYLAGLYRFDECHIDLRPLANFAGVKLIQDRAIALDLEKNQVTCENHPPISFDVLSLDIGSTPAVTTVPGAKDYAIPVKPISKFLTYWETLLAEVQQHPERPLRIGVVGGGAGGVELSLAAQAHLQRIYQNAGQSAQMLEVHLFQRNPELLPERGPWVRRRMQKVMQERGIHLHLDAPVMEVGPDWVRCESGEVVGCDRLFWVTQAAAAPWLRSSGLATDERGFLWVNDYLQSISHPQVFAAGDVATMQNHPRPKAGVFAVRQGKPLTENLRRAIQGRSLQAFVPQKQFLILIGLGDRTAVASRGPLGLGPAAWIWNWKDRIDRQFMEKFSDLKPMMEVATDSTTEPTMRCAGCGSKVGSSVLEKVLTQIQQEQGQPGGDETILIGLSNADDAAVLQVPTGQVMVQTVDYFRALVSDPFLFGQIAAHHALSDLFAMGAKPQSALAIATLPYAPATNVQEQLYHLLSGATQVLHQAGAILIGGHTTEGPELAFGLTCNGLGTRDRLLHKSGMRPGDALILTKPLGTGTLFAADMQLKAKGRWIEGAIASMLLSNQAAAQCFLDYNATACTDITGFGLLGHLLEMMRASQMAIVLDIHTLPILEGAEETTAQGIVSSLYGQNRGVEGAIANLSEVSAHPRFPLLFDPQTSGGLLASVPPEQAAACLTALQQAGYSSSTRIGHVTEASPVPTIRVQA